MSFKDYIYWKFISVYFIKKADKIISVSESTKKDLIEKIGIQEEKIKVIYESYNRNIYKKID
jgi:glycosyltransferase involved in cell wall biosynthesis